METLIHRSVNTKTNEIIDRDYNKAEIAEYKLSLEIAQDFAAANQAKAAARQALLDKLGITADEARLLLG